MATKETKKSVFASLNAIDVNGHTEQKNGLTYLSWAWAWAEVKKLYPDASYEVYHDEQKRPYFEDEELGFMCYTSVTIEGETIEMWLPVMDGANNAMKRKAYEFSTFSKYGEKKHYVAAATMFDINKTIMRCLVKNLAMFGLGLYIYAGEDLPEEVKAEAQRAAQEAAAKAADEAAKAAAAHEAEKKRRSDALTALSLCKTLDEIDMFLEEYGEYKDNAKFMEKVEARKSAVSA